MKKKQSARGTKARQTQEWLTRTEVADLFHVSVSTVTRWARLGHLPVRRTPGGHYRDLAEQAKRLAGASDPVELTRLD